MPRSNKRKAIGRSKAVAMKPLELPVAYYNVSVQLRGSCTVSLKATDYPTLETAVNAAREKVRDYVQASGLTTWDVDKPSCILWDSSEFTLDYVTENE